MEDSTIEDQNVSTQATDNADTIKSVKFSPLEAVKSKAGEGNANNMEMLMDVHIPVLVELGKTEMLMRCFNIDTRRNNRTGQFSWRAG